MYQSYPQPPSYNGGLSYGPPKSYGGSQSHLASPSHLQSSSTSSGSIHGNQSNSVMSKMDEVSALSLLKHLGKDELQLLQDNDSKLTDLINDLSQVRGIQEDHDNLIASNKSIAEYNLSLQPKVEDLKRLVATGYEQQNALKTTLAENKTKLDSYVGQQSLDTLLALLQTETAKVEEDSENLTSDFYDSQVEMEEFLNKFLPQRTQMHLRRIKSEKMAELIREEQHMGGGGASYPPPTSSTGYPPSTSGGVPYPSGPSFQMPQPHYPYH